jgi:pimeloyl-ACP methyl ester carboxylesterase
MNSVGFAMSGSARLYFETAGNGAPLVFIHAGVSDSRMWDPQFEEFAPRWKVVRYDHRGFGKSTFPEEPFSLRDDLASVLYPLGMEKAVLVGCSMGGATALDFALENPQLVSGLVLVGSGVSGFNDPKHLSENTRKYWTELIGLVQKGEVERALEMEAKYWIDGLSRPASEVEPVYRERARQLHRENFSLKRDERQENALTPPAIERLGEVAVPTLIVIGNHDSEDLKRLADRFAEEIPRARLVRMNAAHLPSLEHPAEFNQLLEEFLGSVDR